MLFIVKFNGCYQKFNDNKGVKDIVSIIKQAYNCN